MKERKTRIDKGTVKLVGRDEIALRWIAEQGAINLAHLAVLLSRHPEPRGDGSKGGKISGTISPDGVKQVLRRWLKAEWVEYTNPYRASVHPGYVWLTHMGLKNFAPGFRYVSYRIGTLRHLDAVNQVRLWVEGRAEFEQWISERILRQDKDSRKHMPDAELVFAWKRLAIDVELVRKTHRRLAKIMVTLESEYAGVWYFVNRESEAGVRLLAENYPIRMRHLDTILLHAEASGLSS